MLNELNIKCPENEKLVERRLAQIQKETGTVLDEMQKKAVKEAQKMACSFLQEVLAQERPPPLMLLSAFLKGREQNFDLLRLQAERPKE